MMRGCSRGRWWFGCSLCLLLFAVSIPEGFGLRKKEHVVSFGRDDGPSNAAEASASKFTTNIEDITDQATDGVAVEMVAPSPITLDKFYLFLGMVDMHLLVVWKSTGLENAVGPDFVYAVYFDGTAMQQKAPPNVNIGAAGVDDWINCTIILPKDMFVQEGEHQIVVEVLTADGQETEYGAFSTIEIVHVPEYPDEWEDFNRHLERDRDHNRVSENGYNEPLWIMGSKRSQCDRSQLRPMLDKSPEPFLVSACLSQADRALGNDYARFYQQHLEKYQYVLHNGGAIHGRKKIKVLELGLGCDHSIPMAGRSAMAWHRFFGTDYIELHFVEVRGECVDGFQRLHPEVPFIGHVGDQGNITFLHEVASAGPFDVIVDDGSHYNRHMRLSFQYLFPALTPGGLFFMEDVYSSYFKGPEFEGGPAGHPGTSIDMTKGLLDAMHCDWQDGADCRDDIAWVQCGRGICVYANSEGEWR